MGRWKWLFLVLLSLSACTARQRDSRSDQTGGLGTVSATNCEPVDLNTLDPLLHQNAQKTLAAHVNQLHSLRGLIDRVTFGTCSYYDSKTKNLLIDVERPEQSLSEMIERMEILVPVAQWASQIGVRLSGVFDIDHDQSALKALAFTIVRNRKELESSTRRIGFSELHIISTSSETTWEYGGRLTPALLTPGAALWPSLINSIAEIADKSEKLGAPIASGARTLTQDFVKCVRSLETVWGAVLSKRSRIRTMVLGPKTNFLEEAGELHFGCTDSTEEILRIIDGIAKP